MNESTNAFGKIALVPFLLHTQILGPSPCISGTKLLKQKSYHQG